MIYGTIGNSSNRDANTREPAHASQQHSHANPHGQQRQRKASHASSGGESEMPHQAVSQIIGVAVLEFGVLLHSFVIGMTLAVVERFVTLFVVITLHRETRLSCLRERLTERGNRNVRRPGIGSTTGQSEPS